MASDKLVELLRLGPFKGIETTPAGPYADPQRGSSGPGANPYRVITKALTAERGRTNLTNITIGGLGSQVVAIAPYVPSPSNEQIIGVTFKSSSYSRFIYDPSVSSQAPLSFGSSTDHTLFTQADQYGNVLYDNAGHQYSSADPLNTYLWQYPAPNGVVQGYAVTPVAGGLAPATYIYAFTQVVSDPADSFSQETSVTGDIPDSSGNYPYQVTLLAAGGVQISGTFTGTNADGSDYVTNVYRMSSEQPVWYLLTTLTANTPYTDTASDDSLTANAQLIPDRDPPPLGNGVLWPIMLHKELMWVFAVVQNADTNNLPQTQLWWSNPGRPWEFDRVNNVELVGNSATPNGVTSTTGIYGDVPQACVSLSSLGVLFKTRSTWVVYGDDTNTFVVRKLLDIGTRAAASVVVVPLDTSILAFALGEQGVYMTDGYQYAYVSEAIRSVIDSLSLNDRINAVGSYSNHAYYLSFPERGETWAFYTSTGEWLGPLPYATTFAYTVRANPSKWGGTVGIGEVTAVRQGTNYIDQWFSSGDLDLGAPQNVNWSGPLTDCGAPGKEKEFQRIAVNAPVQPGVMVEVTLTLDPGATPTKTKTWPPFELANATTHILTVPTDFRGYLAQLSVQLSTVANNQGPAVLYSVVAAGVFGRSYVPQDAP